MIAVLCCVVLIFWGFVVRLLQIVYWHCKKFGMGKLARQRKR